MTNCKVIALSNQKGGVGKTTSAIELGVGLANLGYNVLMIDGDPQANLTMTLGYDYPDELPRNICSVLQKVISGEEYNYKDYIIGTSENVDLVPSSLELSGMEVQLTGAISRETLLKDFVLRAKKDYDYILIDCMPSLGVMTINSLVCADSVIIPTQAHYYSTKGLEQLLQTINKVKKTLNPNLTIDGILLTMVFERTKISQEMIQLINEAYGKYVPVFKSTIPHSIKVVEAATNGQSIYSHKKDSKIAEAYERFVMEVDELGKRQRWQDRDESLR